MEARAESLSKKDVQQRMFHLSWDNLLLFAKVYSMQITADGKQRTSVSDSFWGRYFIAVFKNTNFHPKIWHSSFFGVLKKIINEIHNQQFSLTIN